MLNFSCREFNSYLGRPKWYKLDGCFKRWTLLVGLNRPFLSSPGPLYQNKVKCSAFHMEMIFHSRANKTHFHKKDCALGLILKVGVFGTRKWPIHFSQCAMIDLQCFPVKINYSNSCIRFGSNVDLFTFLIEGNRFGTRKGQCFNWASGGLACSIIST